MVVDEVVEKLARIVIDTLTVGFKDLLGEGLALIVFEFNRDTIDDNDTVDDLLPNIVIDNDVVELGVLLDEILCVPVEDDVNVLKLVLVDEIVGVSRIVLEIMFDLEYDGVDDIDFDPRIDFV